MTLQEMMNQITDLGTRIRTLATQLAAQANDPSVPIADLEARQQQLNDMNRRMAALQTAYQTQQAAEAGGVQPLAGGSASQAQQSRNLTDMLKSNEYARAFAYAIQHGVSRKNGRDNERVKILYAALTESGGSPVKSAVTSAARTKKTGLFMHHLLG